MSLEQRLERQSTLQLSIPCTVSIVGCGGVGSWVAEFLALAGVPELWLWDDDTITETNLNRLPLGPSYLHANKASAMRHHLNQLTPQCEVVPIQERWTSPLQTFVPDWIVAATDSHASRTQLYSWSQGYGSSSEPTFTQNGMRCHYLEVSAEGEWGGCTDSPAMFTTPAETNPGYQSVPVHVGSCVAAAAMAVHRILHPTHQPTFNYRFGFNGHSTELQHL